jgi:cephalosporin hydroxylase
MRSLDELFLSFGSDKATIHENAHGYAPHYEEAFAPMRDKPIRLLEIGVGSGASVKGWLAFFPEATVVGVDITQGTNDWNTVGVQPNPRYAFIPGDQASQEFWESFSFAKDGGLDIIIDDGGHYANQVITTHNCLWPCLKPGGFYCIEDLNVSYPDLWEKYGDSFVKEPWMSHMDFLKAKLDDVNRKHEIESMRFSRELVIIKKV